jgi:glycosyltransferase involved in cell wall biosynthesis
LNVDVAADAPIVSVIVPCRNERAGIGRFIASLTAQELPGGGLEILVADGMSSDGTRTILAEWAARDQRVRVVDNPAGYVSHGLNAAIGCARGEYVVRMDVHTRYEPDYVAACVRTLRETGAACVGGPWRPEADGQVSAAIARAFTTRMGSGGARSRDAAHAGPVDTVYLGAWRRATLVQLGGFDEALPRNQDDELSLRIVRGGGVVWQSPAIRSAYTPRNSLRRLLKQYFQYGYWKVAVIRKHRMPASPRHLVPFLFLVLVAGTCVLLPLAPRVALPGVLLMAAYAVLALASAGGASQWLRSPGQCLLTAAAIACMHLGYGAGFALGLLDAVRGKGRRDGLTSGLSR